MEQQRPNPDQLLQQVQAEEAFEQRGKLRIYLGAAPGVGKTHTMLQDAIEKRKDGTDVIIGVVESHHRQEINSLMQDFERLPEKTYTYRDKILTEFDLDGALTRKPQLILVDELAHTNVQGARHTKRWQDIKELLDKGIDVYTTLNVQHIESLNDVITQITHIHVRETIPDFVLEEADTLELVDLSPEDLLKRLQEGKVYFPEQAEIAIDNFFKKGNLIALRELALRVATKYVGTRVLLYRQDQGIQGVWPTNEKILACIGHTTEATKIIRTARRMAQNLQTQWTVIYVDSPHWDTSNAQRNIAIKYLRLAEQLGAQTRILTGTHIVKEVMTFAREQNITQIVIGKKISAWWRSLFTRNLTDEILRHSQEIDVYVITDDTVTPPSMPTPLFTTPWSKYGFAISMILCATVIDFLLFPYLSASDLIMVYVLAITAVAFRGQRGPAVFASVLGVLAYDFCFVSPFYSFSVANIQHFLTLLVMLIVTQAISHLAVLARRQSEIASLAERNISALYALSHQLARTRGIHPLIEIGTKYVAQAFNCDALILLAEHGHFHDDPKNSSVKKKVLPNGSMIYDKMRAGEPIPSLLPMPCFYP